MHVPATGGRAIMAKVQLIILNRNWNKHYQIVALLGAAAVLAAAAIVFLSCRTYTVKDSSMSPSLKAGDKLYYCRFQQFQYDDLVLFQSDSSGRMCVKRVVGLAGDTIRLGENGHVVRNGVLLKEPYATLHTGGISAAKELIVGENTLFVLSDNRNSFSALQNVENGQIPLSSVYGIIVRIVRVFH